MKRVLLMCPSTILICIAVVLLPAVAAWGYYVDTPEIYLDVQPRVQYVCLGSDATLSLSAYDHDTYADPDYYKDYLDEFPDWPGSFPTRDPESGVYTSTWIHEFDEPGKYEYHISADDDEGEGADDDPHPVIDVTIYVIKAEVQAFEFTSDHGVMTDYQTDFGGCVGGDLYDPPGWEKYPASVCNPVSHTQGTTVDATVRIKVQPSGLDYDLQGTSSLSALSFTLSGLSSTGEQQSVYVSGTNELPSNVDRLNSNIGWTVNIKDDDGVCKAQCSAGDSPTWIFLTWDTPYNLFEETHKRVEWVCEKAEEATSIAQCCDMLWDAVAANTQFGDLDTDDWHLLDGGSGDCDNLARCMRDTVFMIGDDTAYLSLVRASTDSSCTGDPESRNCPVHGPEKLMLDFPGLNQYEGCCCACGSYYAIEPKKKTSTDLAMLNALKDEGVTQVWCRGTWPYMIRCDQPGATPPIPSSP